MKIFAFLLVLSSLALAESGYNPVFPDSPSPFGDRNYRPGAWSTFPPPSSPYYRSGQAPTPPGWEMERPPRFGSPFANAFRIQSSVFPTSSGIYIRPVRPKTDVIIELGLNPKTIVASVSVNCKQGTMNSAAYAFVSYYRFLTVRRHATIEQIYANIAAAPEGTETFVLAAHGNSGFIGAFTIENVGELGKRLKAKKIKKIVLGTCYAAWGEQGERFISELANVAQAEVYAWDQPVYMENTKTYLKEGGNLVIAVPEELNGAE